MIELADIIAPVAPPPAPLPYGWIAIGIAIFILIAFIVLRVLWRRNRNRRAALTQLKRTERALRQGNLDARAAAFQAAQALHCVYSLRQQSDQLASPAWMEFIAALDRARYAAHPIGNQDATQLLATTREWIMRAP
jgi:hypothetical protein